MNPDPHNSIFQKAVAFVNQTSRHLFLTGKAGTGKTTFLKYIRENTFKKIAVVAPTGVAAINAGGVTIHSFFQLPFGPFIPTELSLRSSYTGELNNRASLLSNLRLTREKKRVIQELDLLIIDEISMVRADLLDAVDTVMRHVRQKPFLAFGGVQMVYIGDLFQLPPVARNEEWELLREYYNSPFFFDSQVLQLAPPLFVELKKIYRQRDDTFISILNNIRNNCCTTDDLDLLHRYYKPDFLPAKKENYITLTSHNSKADHINEKELARLPGRLYRFQAKIKGNFNERAYPAEKELQLKQGAQIMFLKNDKGEVRRFFNGKIGTIKRIEKEKIVVVFPNNENELELEQETWKNIQYNYNGEKDQLDEEELGTYTQYPIKLAWAITIHKSQGLTFEKAIIDAGASFAPGQVYVSLSRLTALQGLVLHSRITPSCISTDSRVVSFMQNELAEESLQQTLEQEQKVFVRQCLLQGFAWQKIADAVNRHLEEYEHRQIPQQEACVEWANQLCEAANKQNEVAGKFIKQLEYLFVTCEEDGYKKLEERTSAAAVFFLKELDDQLLAMLKFHINEVKVRQKVKRYVKELHELSAVFVQKKQHVQQAVQLAGALRKAVHLDDLLAMVEKNKRPTEAEQQVSHQKKLTPEKGESSKMSLDLFRRGRSIADISAERGMAESTIEGHLANFVKTGEVDVLDLVDAATLDKVVAIISAEPQIGFAALKEKAGGNISYGAIKAITNYHERLKDEVV